MIPPIAIPEFAPEPYRSDRSLLELQQAFLDLRFGMFIHFNMATFQDREWGDPTSPASLFQPTHLDTDQWASAAKSAGMTWGCLTTKHHDGFCLWPTRTRSAHAGVDVVRSYVDSFRKHGLRVALYYSILDLRQDVRHFNVTQDKVQLIKEQLTELFSNYGEIDILIIDGWDAPWSRITYEEVPFAEIYGMLKALQPNCLISDLNASQYPPSGLYYTDVKAFEQNAGQHIPEASSVPAYSCVTLTDGWFWKSGDEDRPLKSAKQVVEEWLVPQNENHCNLIVNAPPTREGRLAPNVVARLEEIGKLWKNPGPAKRIRETVVITTPNLATGRPIHASSSPDTVGPDLANDGNFHSSWEPEHEGESWLEVELDAALNTLALVSDGKLSSFKVEAGDGSKWREIHAAQRPQPVEVVRVPRLKAERLRFVFEGPARIFEIGVYEEPRN